MGLIGGSLAEMTAQKRRRLNLEREVTKHMSRDLFSATTLRPQLTNDEERKPSLQKGGNHATCNSAAGKIFCSQRSRLAIESAF